MSMKTFLLWQQLYLILSHVAPHLPCIVVAVLVHAVALVPHVLARVLVAEARERDRVLQEHRVILEACPTARRVSTLFRTVFSRYSLELEVLLVTHLGYIQIAVPKGRPPRNKTAR